MHTKKYDNFENEAKQYKKILKEYKKTGKQFIDSNFHPNLQIPESKLPNMSHLINDWKRIDEIYPSPLFKEELINPDFIKQGNIGDCYFISALSRIAMQSSLVQRLFKKSSPNKILGTIDDSINIKCGAVVIYFYCFGMKTPVLIDTLLPVHSNGVPIFSRLSDKTKSPWFCLVEKAYAKFNGSYSNIICNSMSRAIYSLFRYYPRYQSLQNLQKPEKINKMSVFDRFMKYQKKGVIMSCLLGDIGEDEAQKKGLIKGHVYLLMKVRIEGDKKFFCLRNPWGSYEWKGDWSKDSDLWTPELIDRLGVSKEENGTFWMIDADFFKYFHVFSLSYPTPPKSKSKKLLFQLPPNDSFVESPTYVFELINELPENKKCKINFVCQRANDGGNTPENLHYELLINQINENSQYFYENNSTVFTYSKNLIGKKPKIEISFRRTGKSDFIDDIYLRVFCQYKFNLYEKTDPIKIIPEDENPAVVFDPFSPRHNVGRCIVIKNIDGIDTLVFNSSSNNISESEKEKVLKAIAGFSSSNSSSPVDSTHSGDDKNIPNDEKKNDLSDDSDPNYSFDESTTMESFTESTIKDLSDYSTTMDSFDESTTKDTSENDITKDLSDDDDTTNDLSDDDDTLNHLSDDDDTTKDLSDDDTLNHLSDDDDTTKDLSDECIIKKSSDDDIANDLSDDDTVIDSPNDDENPNNVNYAINKSLDTEKPKDEKIKLILNDKEIFQYITANDNKIKNNSHNKSLPPIDKKEENKRSTISSKLSLYKKPKNIFNINKVPKYLKPKEIIHDKQEVLRNELIDFDNLINLKIKLIKKKKKNIKRKEKEINSIKDKFEKEKHLVTWETQKLEYNLEKENLVILKTQYNNKKQQYCLERKKFNETSNTMPIYKQSKIIKPKYYIKPSPTPPIIKTNHIDLFTPKKFKQIKSSTTTFVPLYCREKNKK